MFRPARPFAQVATYIGQSPFREPRDDLLSLRARTLMPGPVRIRLQLLGPFGASSDESSPRAIQIAGRHRRALLAYLAMQPTCSETRERLAALLWGNRFDKQARQSLRQCLLALRKELGSLDGEILRVERDFVSLDPSRVTVDARDFIEAAQTEDAEGCERAVALYAGVFLDGLDLEAEAFSDWLRSERARIASEAARMLKRHAEQQNAAGHGPQAIGAAERLVNLDPLDEMAQRVLLRVVARYRGREAALACAASLVRLLRRELDVGPEPETAALIDEIKRGEIASVAARPVLRSPEGERIVPTASDPADDAGKASAPSACQKAETAQRRSWCVPGVGRLGVAMTLGLACTLALLARAPSLSNLADAGLFATKDASPVPKMGQTFRDCDDCPEMIVVPAGSFVMGSSPTEVGRFDNEGPQRKVTIPEPFAVGRFAVTFQEWETCLADGGCNGYAPSDESFGRGRHPVINVSWLDTRAYLAWLSRKTGMAYRLLSEAEREYVARAGTNTPFWWGATISTQQSNYDGNYAYWDGTKGEKRGRTVPVDFFEPNPWGLYQVHGNSNDWVEDCWHTTFEGAPTDGSGWITGECVHRVLRGGSYFNFPWVLRSAFRYGHSASHRESATGFRVARTLSAESQVAHLR